MLYVALADTVAALHLAYVAFVVVGWILIVVGGTCGWGWVRNFWFRSVHLALMGVVAVEAVWNVTCPLTEWENALRAAAGQATYGGSFVGRLVDAVLFWDAPPWVFRVAHLVFAAAVVAALIWIPPDWPKRLRRRCAEPPRDAEASGRPGGQPHDRYP